MSKDKIEKTNAMRILDRMKISYEVQTYECREFKDAVTVANMLGQSCEATFKTLVLQGKSRQYYVFVLPADKELDLKKCAVIAKEKSVEMVHVKDINAVTGYIRGCCTAVGMKNSYPVFIYISAKEQEKIIVSSGKLGMQLMLAPDDLCRACNGTYADFIQ